jgi:hypothetical protein
MASSLFVSEVLKGITNGMVTGMNLRQQKEQAAQDAQFKQQQFDLQTQQMNENKLYREQQFGLDKSKFEEDKSYKQRLLDLDYAKLKAEQSKKEMPQKLTATETLKVNEGKVIPETLNKFAKIMEDNKNLFSISDLPAAGTINSWYESIKNSSQVKKFDSEKRAASQQFGRYMEGGVLRKEDEVKYEKMFPAIGDSYGVAQAKLETINSLLTRKYNSDISALQSQNKSTEGLELENKTKNSQENNKNLQTKVINGITYEKVTGGWIPQKQPSKKMSRK